MEHHDVVFLFFGVSIYDVWCILIHTCSHWDNSSHNAAQGDEIWFPYLRKRHEFKSKTLLLAAGNDVANAYRLRKLITANSYERRDVPHNGQLNSSLNSMLSCRRKNAKASLS